MKKHPIPVCLVLAVSIALVVVACTLTQKHAPGVSIQETSVQIYPGTKISSDDQRALDAVLKNFNKSLYKIRTYDRGKLVKTQGSLEEARIDQKLVADANETFLKLKGVSNLTLQIGVPNRPAGVPNRPASNVSPSRASSPPPPPPWTLPSQKELRNSERLVSRVRPILQKYSQPLELR